MSNALALKTIGVMHTPRSEKQLRYATYACMALALVCLLFYPEIASAQDAKSKVAGAAQKAYDLIFSVVYWICGIAVIVSGLAATFGRMEWSQFGKIVAGIVVVFSATSIIDYFK